jgi:hypothetical protein
MSDLETLVAKMTLADLATQTGRSVADIVAFALGARIASAPRAVKAAVVGAVVAKRRGRKGKRGRLAKAVAAAKGSLRTAAGRTDLDDRVLAAIRAASGPTRSVDIESQVGGTPQQRRAALHRLLKLRKIKREGAARATVYIAR